LPQDHAWRGGSITSEKGIQFTPNLPTEEVFTLPHQERVEGIVTASLPLSYGETLIHDFSLTFEAGQVVKVTAGQGEAVLNKLLDTDAGARRLGEVALVPHKSPVAQVGLLFYNTLFDENAATHLALGQAYNFCLRGGESMSQEEFTSAGGNHSLVHVDFMIGSGKMDVDGLHEGQPPEAVMRGGEWVI
jgi:aminopeptidase